MSTETTVENKPVEVEVKQSEKLKASLQKAREQVVNQFVVRELPLAKNFGEIKERGEGAGVSCDEIYNALGSHHENLLKNQAERAKQPVRNFVDQHISQKKDWEELAKTESILRTVAGGCVKAPIEDAVSENPGRRLVATILKGNLGNESENKNEESDSTPVLEKSN